MDVAIKQNDVLFLYMKKWYLKEGLKKLARHRLMNLTILSKITGISRATFDRWRSDPKNEPNPEKLRITAETLNMKLGRENNDIYLYEDNIIEEHDEERREDYNKPGMSKIINIVGNLSDIKRIKLVEFLECGIGNDGHNQSI